MRDIWVKLGDEAAAELSFGAGRYFLTVERQGESGFIILDHEDISEIYDALKEELGK